MPHRRPPRLASSLYRGYIRVFLTMCAHDRRTVFHDKDDTFDVVSYIVANPVRAGMCESACEYPFSGSSRYSLQELAESVQWRPR